MEIHISNIPQESIKFLHLTGRAVITKRSPFSGNYHTATMKLTEPDYSNWLAGISIQNALPHLSADEREFLMTGITPAEWDATFKDEE